MNPLSQDRARFSIRQALKDLAEALNALEDLQPLFPQYLVNITRLELRLIQIKLTLAQLDLLLDPGAPV